MQRTLDTRAYIKDQPKVLPVILGGTGSINEGIDNAIENLGGISKLTYGLPNGICNLNSDGKVSLNNLPSSTSAAKTMLFGSETIYTNSINEYKISNYDSQTTYNLSCASGSISLVIDKVIFIAPTTPGIVIITINGINYGLNVIIPYIEKPVIKAFPNPNSVSLSPLFVTSNFIAQGITNTHLSTSWQFSTDSEFGPLVTNGVNDDIVNLTSFQLTGLELNTIYYARVKYKSVEGLQSEWSNTYSFKTSNKNYPDIFIQALKSPIPSSWNNYGNATAISNDGTVLVVGDTGYQTLGAIHIYKLVSGIFEKDFTLPNVNTSYNTNFGINVVISNDKQIIIVTANMNDENNDSHAYVFKTTVTDDYSSLTLVDTITSTKYGEYFGSSLNISADNSLIVITGCAFIKFYTIDLLTGLLTEAYSFNLLDVGISQNTGWSSKTIINDSGTRVIIAYAGFNNYNGKVLIFDYVASNWELTELTSPFSHEFFDFGYDICGHDNDLIVMSYPDYEGGPDQSIYYYKFNGTVWNLVNTINVPENDIFGYYIESVYMSPDGTILSINAPDRSSLETMDNPLDIMDGTGVVYLMKKNNDVWEHFGTLKNPDPIFYSYFGYRTVFSNNNSRIIINANNNQLINTWPYDNSLLIFKN